MSVLASNTVRQEDEELAFDKKVINHYINEADIEKVDDQFNSDEDEFEPEEKRRLKIKKAALLEELENENPDMSNSEIDEWDPDFE
jgi:hypothetical protein